jgi:4,5-DOPA dioxygenase extradiol
MAMKRNEFVKAILGMSAVTTLSGLHSLASTLPVQGKKMPVLFTSHGSPMDIVRTREERPFWNALYELGKQLRNKYEIKAVLVISAHWCTRGTYVNISAQQEQVYDYYGFPDNYYKVKYDAPGAPEIAHEVKNIVTATAVTETTEWGLDHGAWPMLMHLFPEADIPVFQMSIDYHAKPEYHYELGRQLKSLREKGVLIIGSGSLVHNLELARQRMIQGDTKPYGWEMEYDAWVKKQLTERNFDAIIQYQTSHKLGKLAAPTPDHYVPVLYSLGLSDAKDDLYYFYESPASLPGFSENSFIIGNQ